MVKYISRNSEEIAYVLAKFGKAGFSKGKTISGMRIIFNVCGFTGVRVQFEAILGWCGADNVVAREDGACSEFEYDDDQ